MNAPANTLLDMIAGYAVIFILLMGYVVSLILRFRRLYREEAYLQELDEDQER